jgi:hypothetical protein
MWAVGTNFGGFYLVHFKSNQFCQTQAPLAAFHSILDFYCGLPMLWLPILPYC